MTRCKGKEPSNTWHPNPQQLSEMEKMSGLGLSLQMIADIFDIHQNTLIRERDRNPEVKRALEKGKALACLKLTKRAFELAVEGNVRMLMFLLANRMGWTVNGQKPSTTEGEGENDGATEARTISEDDFKRARDEARKLRVISSQSS